VNREFVARPFGYDCFVLKEGALFGRYRILATLGKGGMGHVYRAHDTLLRRDVAVKMLHAERTSGEERTVEEAAALLLREARAAAALSHPNAVAVFDVGEVDGRGYIAMELVSGKPLRAYVGDPTVAPDRKLRWLVAVASALDAAHQAGLVHRDIKPENILVRDDDSIKVLDFGIAKRIAAEPPSGTYGAASPASFQTQDGQIRGTPGYMAPEFVETGTFDPRSDQYAWGVVAYELFAGIHPARTSGLRGVPELLTERVPGLPLEVSATVMRALSRPDLRFPSMSAIAATLQKVTDVSSAGPAIRVSLVSQLGTTATTATTAAIAGVSASRARTGTTTLFLGLGIGIVALAGVVIGAHSLRRHRSDAPVAPGRATGSEGAPTPPIAFHPSHIRRITFGDSCEEFPSFTPDSKSIIYDSTVGSDSFLFELGVDGQSPRQITKIGHGWDIAPAVSPDGTRIAFLRMTDLPTQTLVVDRAGLTEGHPVATGVVRPCWSADGRSVWAGEPGRLERHDAVTGAVDGSLTPPSDLAPVNVMELPGGGFLLNMRPDHETGSVGLALLPAGGPLRWLLHDETDEGFAVTPDGRHVLAARIRPGVETELLDVPLDGSPVTSLAASGATVFKGINFSKDAHHVVWSTCRGQDELMRLGAHGAFEPFERDSEWNDYAVAWSAATGRAVVLSDRTGRVEPWVVEPSGSTHRLALPLHDLIDLAISDDGTWLAFIAVSQPIYVVPIDGSAPPRALAGGNGSSAAFVRASHDVAYTVADETGHFRVVRASADGGPSEPLVESNARFVATSPVDDRLAYLAGANPSQLMPMLYDPVTRGSAVLSTHLGAGTYRTLRFSPDGKRVFLLPHHPELIEIVVATGAVAQRTELAEAWSNIAFVRGGLVFTRQRWRGNLWIGDDPF
jgi:serine/threonine protein kinase